MGLSAQGLTWRAYDGIFTSNKSLAGRPEVVDYQDEKCFEDAAKGTWPNAAWLNSGFLTDSYAKGGHPPASLCGGENYAVSVLNAVMSSQQWSTTALFLVWDDWGGFYHHVDPLVVERWEAGTPATCWIVSISTSLHFHRFCSQPAIVSSSVYLDLITIEFIHFKNRVNKCSNIIHSEILPFSMCTCYIFLYMPTHNCCAGLASWRRNTDAKPVVVRSINQIHPRRE